MRRRVPPVIVFVLLLLLFSLIYPYEVENSAVPLNLDQRSFEFKEYISSVRGASPYDYYKKLEPELTNEINNVLEESPLYFIENRLMEDDSVEYYSPVDYGGILFRKNQVEFIYGDFSYRINFEGSLYALEKSDYKINYYTNKKIAENISTYKTLIYRGENYDVIFYGKSNSYKYDIVVKTDINKVVLDYDFEGEIYSNGKDLFLENDLGTFIESIPYSYSEEGEQLVKYVVDKDLISFEGTADKLIIDPFGGSKNWSTILASGASEEERGQDLVIDSSGYVFVTGYTKDALNFVGGSNNSYGANSSDDIFIVKLNPDGSKNWSTVMGSTFGNEEISNSIGLDGSGNVYIGGYSEDSANFAGTINYSYGTNYSFDAIVSKLDSNGRRLWSTALGSGEGGSGTTNGEFGESISVSSSGDIYFTGNTYNSSEFVGASNYTYGSAAFSGFVVKINADGSKNWSTLFESVELYGISVGSSEHVFVTGSNSPSFSVTANNTYGEASDYSLAIFELQPYGEKIWFTKVNSGAGGTNKGYGIAVDSIGNVYTSGHTSNGSTFAGGVDYSYGTLSSYDTFVIKLNSAGEKIWATAIGSVADQNEYPNDLYLDSMNVPYITGHTTNGSSFAGTPDYTYGTLSSEDVFAVNLDADGVVQWASVFGSSDSTNERGEAIAASSNDRIFITGYTANGTGFVSGSNYSYGTNSSIDVFVLKMENERIGISVCQNITSSGYYYLTADLNADNQNCIEIKTNNVILDLNGHLIANSTLNFEKNALIKINKTSSPDYTNITVKNGYLENCTHCFYSTNTSNATVTNMNFYNVSKAIDFSQSNNNPVYNINITNNTVEKASLIAISAAAGRNINISNNILTNIYTGVTISSPDYVLWGQKNIIANNYITDIEKYGISGGEDLLIENNTITNVIGGANSHAIYDYLSHRVNISNNTIHGCEDDCIHMELDYVKFYNNTVYDSAATCVYFVVTGKDNHTYQGNVIHNCSEYGLYGGTPDTNISDNIIYNTTDVGLYISSNSRSHIFNNTIYDSDSHGIVSTGYYATIYDNNASDNRGNGYVFYGDHCTIENNTASNNDLAHYSLVNVDDTIFAFHNITGEGVYALELNNSEDNFIRNNTFNHSSALQIKSDSNNNIIYYNRFYNGSTFFVNDGGSGNSFNTTVIGTYEGNYFEDVLDYLIFDSNGDGFGDYGEEYPYNASMDKFIGDGADYGPMTTRVDTITPIYHEFYMTPDVFNNNWTNTSDPHFFFNFTDETATRLICRLIIDGSVNKTNTTIQNASLSWMNASNIFVEGSYTYAINCSDGSTGNQTPTVNFYVDLTNPELSVSLPQEGQTYTTDSVTLNYTATDSNLSNCTYTCNGNTYTLATCQNLSTIENLQSGSNSLNVTAYDESGRYNTSTTITFTIDNGAISNCQWINESGYYNLLNDIDAGGESCIKINASNVVFDLNGHYITNSSIGGNAPILVNPNKAPALTNITVINGTLNSSYHAMNISNVSNSNFCNLTIMNMSYYGIYLSLNQNDGSNSINITNNTLLNINSTAIYAYGGYNINISKNNIQNNSNGISIGTPSTNDYRNFIKNNTIRNGSYGIVIGSSGDILIEDNVIYEYGRGIYAGVRSNITNNTIYDCDYAFYLSNSDNMKFYNNTVHDISADGFRCSQSGGSDHDNHTLIGNEFYNIGSYAIRPLAGSYFVIEDNLIHNATGGISTYPWSNVTNNTVYNTTVGIEGLGVHSIFSYNNLSNNTIGFNLWGSDNCTLENNTIEKNGIGINVSGLYTLENNISYNNITNNILYGIFSASDFNTFKNNTLNNSKNLKLISGSDNNTFYYNKFYNNSAVFHVNDSGSYNQFNTSVAGVPQGNYFEDVLSYEIYDTNLDGFGDAGDQYPYNASLSKFDGNGADYGPITTKVDTTPPIYNLYYMVPDVFNNNWTNTSNPYFFFNFTDDVATTLTCRLVLDGTINNTNSSTQNATLSSINASDPIAEGTYTYAINCSTGGTSNQTPTITFHVDLTNPELSVSLPQNGQTYAPEEPTLNYTATDSNLSNCTYTCNGNTYTLATCQNLSTIENLQSGSNTLNVTAYDESGRYNTSETIVFTISGGGISACQDISSSGNYYLEADLEAGGNDCIVINASNVYLDLRDYSITNASLSNKAGIRVNQTSGTLSNITVYNGTIKNSHNALFSFNASNSSFYDIHVYNSSNNGFEFSSGELAQNINITNNSIENSTNYAVFAEIYDSNFSNNYIRNATKGVYIDPIQSSSESFPISNNIISEVEEFGIFVNDTYAVFHLDVRNNLIYSVTGSESFGFTVDDPESINFTNNTIHSVAYKGLYFGSSKPYQVINNTIYDAVDSCLNIFGSISDDLDILQGNLLYNCSQVSYYGENDLVDNNTVYDTTNSIAFIASGSNITFTRNNISDNAGIGLSSGLDYSILENNTFDGNGGAGISLSGSQSSNFSYNNLSRNAYAVNFSNSDSNIFKNNTFNNSKGVEILSGSDSNVFYYNRFYNSSATFYINNSGSGNQFNTTVGGTPQGNYFADILDQSIFDTNADGFGDAGDQYPYNASLDKFIGNGADYGPITTKVDNNPPIYTIYYMTPDVFNNNWTNTSNPYFFFNFTDDVATTLTCRVIIDGSINNTNSSTQNATLSSVNASFPFTAGTYTYAINCSDGLFTNQTPTITFHVDLTNPRITLLLPENGQTYTSSTATLNYTATDSNLSNCTYTCNGNTYTLATCQNLSTIENLQSGSNSLNVTAYDESGRSNTSETTTFTINDNFPVLIVSMPENQTNYTYSDVTLNYTTYDPDGSVDTCNYTINGISYNIPGCTNLSTVQNLVNGSNALNVTVWDDGGASNTSSTIFFSIDDKSPSITIQIPESGGNYTSSTVTLNYTAIDAETSVQSCNYTINGNNYNIPSCANLSTIQNLQNGSNKINVTILDLFNNSNTSSTVTFTVDDIAPAYILSNLLPEDDNLTNDPTPDFTFNFTDNIFTTMTCNLTINGSNYGTNTSVQNGTLTTITANSMLTRGDYYWNITCYDAVGNYNTTPTRNISINASIDSTPYFTYLSPDTGTSTKQTDIAFSFNVSDLVYSTFNCTLYVDGEEKANNASVQNQTTTTLNASLGLGNHEWYVNCSNTLENTNQSASRGLLIYKDSDPPDPPPPPPENESTEINIDYEINCVDKTIHVELTDENGDYVKDARLQLLQMTYSGFRSYGAWYPSVGYVTISPRQNNEYQLRATRDDQSVYTDSFEFDCYSGLEMQAKAEVDCDYYSVTISIEDSDPSSGRCPIITSANPSTENLFLLEKEYAGCLFESVYKYNFAEFGLLSVDFSANGYNDITVEFNTSSCARGEGEPREFEVQSSLNCEDKLIQLSIYDYELPEFCSNPSVSSLDGASFEGVCLNGNCLPECSNIFTYSFSENQTYNFEIRGEYYNTTLISVDASSCHGDDDDDDDQQQGDDDDDQDDQDQDGPGDDDENKEQDDWLSLIDLPEEFDNIKAYIEEEVFTYLVSKKKESSLLLFFLLIIGLYVYIRRRSIDSNPFNGNGGY